MDDGPLQIRSYRVVFDLERRIHRIDRFRVPLPYGLPLRSLAYAVVALAAVVVAGRVPALGAAVSALPAPARLVLLPVAISCGLTRLRVDGRSAHAAAACWVRYVSAPRDRVGFSGRRLSTEVRLGDLVMAPGLSGTGWRRGVLRGPAELFADVPLARRDRRRHIELAPARSGAAAPESFVVASGQRLVLR